MKKVKLIYLVSFVAIAAMSCKKQFLEDMKSFTKFDESIFKSDVQTGWYVDRMYYDYFSAFRSPILSVTGLYNDTRTRLTEEMGGTVPDLINPQKTLIN